MKVVSINAPTLLWPCDWDSFLCWKNVLRTCHRLSLPYRSQWKQTSTLLLWWQSPWILRVKWWACLCISTWGPVVGRMGTWKLQGYIQPQEEKNTVGIRPEVLLCDLSILHTYVQACVCAMLYLKLPTSIVLGVCLWKERCGQFCHNSYTTEWSLTSYSRRGFFPSLTKC